MNVSYHDRILSKLNHLEYFDFYPNMEPDEIFYASRDTYLNNLHQLECQNIVLKKLSPTCVIPNMLHDDDDHLFDFLILENFSLWIEFILHHVEFLFPVIMNPVQANRNSYMIETIVDETKIQLERISEMKKKHNMNQEEMLRLSILELDVKEFLTKIESIEKKYWLLFFSIFYHGKFTKGINTTDIIREIHSFL